MKKVIMITALILLLQGIFATAMNQNTAMIQVMPYDYCIDKNGNPKEGCFEYAQPLSLDDCNLIKPKFDNYENLLLGCYMKLAYRNPTACDLMPFNDANKQLCFIRARSCEKIIDSSEKDACYNAKLDCDKISAEGKRNICLSTLNKKNTDSLIGTILYYLAIAILIISPLIVIAIIIKTILDFFKHISIISWVIRITLIIFFIVLWVIVGILFLAFTMAPKIYY